ncbi:cardiolipin synthase [Neisseria leonii]|uniref:cardiolipin synthase n=1 Tax=Neisseria leonii TaxID=2995413 RepID=UPI00237BABA0|nr:cardiolipin synthase [Neisseria sp. 3986]MDD9324941.1 cardiolipin synthase [Neisseria sp. 3986]
MPILYFHLLVVLPLSLRIFLRDGLLPEKRVAWCVAVWLFPFGGSLLYFLFGEISLGRGAARTYHALSAALRENAGAAAGTPALIDAVPDAYRAPFAYLHSINGFYPVAGNRAELMTDGSSARARLLADMEAARREICVLYYIWLDDDTGRAVARALIRAAQRGVVCRALADGLGSRAFLRSRTWRDMAAAGVQTAVALPIDRPLHTILTGRIDLRNHRKITLIDGEITHCGSQNCADESFAVKARFAPWVDIMLRWQGPVAAQMRLLFAADWQSATGRTLPELPAAKPFSDGIGAQVMGEGPTERAQSTPQFLAALIGTAQRQLWISTPYFVPDATVLSALCAAALRGVDVRLILPQRNDSRIVAAASRSHYRSLLAAGVAVFEYAPGLLHAKTLTLDGRLCLTGSTNLDRRSFDLNFENNILFDDAALCGQVIGRQRQYLADSQRITEARIAAWPVWRRLWQNLVASASPIL